MDTLEQRSKATQGDVAVDCSVAAPADVAIVVPVFDDAPALAALLERVAVWPRQPAELVVVAAGDDAALAELVTRHGGRLLRAAPNRGAQLDLGARAATARTLWFLHADAVPAADALAAIEAASTRGADSGCFRFAFGGSPTLTRRLLAGLTNLRVRLGGIAYGDQGLFVEREAYLAVGGFAPTPLFEEVPLVRRLRRRGRFRPLKLAIEVSPRRWERDGWWTRALRNRWLALCYMLGVPAEALARSYQRRAARQAASRR